LLASSSSIAPQQRQQGITAYKVNTFYCDRAKP
jgi:hypothetical protein